MKSFNTARKRLSQDVVINPTSPLSNVQLIKRKIVPFSTSIVMGKYPRLPWENALDSFSIPILNSSSLIVDSSNCAGTKLHSVWSGLLYRICWSVAESIL